MVIRIAASYLVIFVIEALLAADETTARPGGGFAAGRTVTPPSAIHPAGARPVIHPGRAAASGTAGLRSQALRRHAFRNRHIGAGWPGWWGSWPGYEPYYNSAPYLGPSGDSESYDLPPLGPSFPAMGYRTPDRAPVSVYVIPYRPGCDSETQKVPGKGGEERSITIVRC
jgi:hypothetical protein